MVDGDTLCYGCLKSESWINRKLDNDEVNLTFQP